MGWGKASIDGKEEKVRREAFVVVPRYDEG
jgi:hypothetical protein